MAAYKDWIEQIDINVDYYAAFIKAWIAFNSWYKDKYQKGTDASIIDEIKSKDNDFKTHMRNFLRGDSEEAREFQNRIGKLHHKLYNASLSCQARAGASSQITFSSIALINKVTSKNETYRYNKYILNRNGNSFNIKIEHKDNGSERFSYNQTAYDETALQQQLLARGLSEECQQQCMALYKDISPYIIKSVLDETSDKKFGDVAFISNIDEVCAGVIDVLYLLRCALMHGELTPNKSSSEVYEQAYYVLMMVLKKLS